MKPRTTAISITLYKLGKSAREQVGWVDNSMGDKLWVIFQDSIGVDDTFLKPKNLLEPELEL